MDPIYGRFRDLADRMLQKFGADAVLLKPGTLTGPPHRPVQGPPTRHSLRVFRVSKTITSQTDPRISITKNSFLISADLNVLVEKADKIETPSDFLTITDVREIAPTFMTLLWVAQVEG